SASTPVWASCTYIAVEPCLTDAEIDAAFSSWKAGFDFGGGCDPYVKNQAEFDALDWDDPKWGNMQDGYLVTFDYIVWDNPDCSRDTVTCTFTIPPCAPECGTAYGYYAGNDTCFMPTFSNWGWSNYLIQPEFEYTADLPLYQGNSDCTPFTPIIGWVTITYINDGSMTVHYSVNSPYYMTEVHVYVGCTPFPMKNGNPTVSPGQYTIGENLVNMETEFEIEFTKVYGDVYVIAHAVTCEIPGWPYDPDPEVLFTADSYDEEIDCLPKSAQIAVSANPEILPASDLRVYPNPFDEKVTFEFVSGVNAYATLEIFNITGQKIARIMDQYVEKGVLNKVDYKPDSDVSGMYIYKLRLDGNTQVGRIIYKE
ncbi:MAG: T9SS type A sorting domain-containing protein, partial [Bacteroidota bacterium]